MQPPCLITCLTHQKHRAVVGPCKVDKSAAGWQQLTAQPGDDDAPKDGIFVNGTWHYANYPILDPSAYKPSP